MGDESSALKIVIVDEDSTEASRAFIKLLDESEELEVTPATKDEAVSLVRRGKRLAYVVLPPGFGKAHSQPFGGESVKIGLGIDPSRSAEAGLLQGVLTKFMYQGIQDVFSNPAKMREQIASSLVDVQSATDMDPVVKATLTWFLPMVDQFFGELPVGNDGPTAAFQQFEFERADVSRNRSGPGNPYEISFPQGIIWGVMSCSAAFGISLVVERSRGTLVRLRIAPINRAQILGGKGIACLLTTAAVPTLILLLGALLFKIRPDSWSKLALAVLSISVCFVGVMMLLSVLGKTEQSAGGIGWMCLTVMAMIGGGMVPLAFMPAWMQTISHISPVKWSILAMEGAIWRNFTFPEMATPCVILVSIGVVGFFVGTRAFRWTEAS